MENQKSDIQLALSVKRGEKKLKDLSPEERYKVSRVRESDLAQVAGSEEVPRHFAFRYGQNRQNQ